MREVYVIGAHMIKFGRYLERTIPELAAMTATPCLEDAGIDKSRIQALWFANSAWGEYRRQVCIRGQVALRPMGIDGIPITNVENACAGGSTAFHHAWMGVASGLYDVTMALGAEKIYDTNQQLVFSGFLTGLDVGNILRFEKDFPGAGVVRLTRNYRSTQPILTGAASILNKEEPLQGQNRQGELICLAPCRTGAEEAEMVVAEIERLLGGTSLFSVDSGRAASGEEGEGLGFGDVAVLFRLNSQGEALEEAFERSGIPYLRSGEAPLVMRHPVHEIWRFLLAASFAAVPHYREFYLSLPGMERQERVRILESFHSTGLVAEVVERAISAHGFQISEEAREPLRRLRELAADFQQDLKAFLDRLSLDRGIDHETLSGDRVALMSLHAAKGLEWPVVFITGCEDQLLPCTLFGDRDDAEEKRLFYVGMTRARKRLILSHAKSRILSGRALQSNPSPFLTMIPSTLCAPLSRTGWKPRKKPKRQLDLF